MANIYTSLNSVPMDLDFNGDAGDDIRLEGLVKTPLSPSCQKRPRQPNSAQRVVSEASLAATNAFTYPSPLEPPPEAAPENSKKSRTAKRKQTKKPEPFAYPSPWPLLKHQLQENSPLLRHLPPELLRKSLFPLLEPNDVTSLGQSCTLLRALANGRPRPIVVSETPCSTKMGFCKGDTGSNQAARLDVYQRHPFRFVLQTQVHGTVHVQLTLCNLCWHEENNIRQHPAKKKQKATRVHVQIYSQAQQPQGTDVSVFSDSVSSSTGSSGAAMPYELVFECSSSVMSAQQQPSEFYLKPRAEPEPEVTSCDKAEVEAGDDTSTTEEMTEPSMSESNHSLRNSSSESSELRWMIKYVWLCAQRVASMQDYGNQPSAEYMLRQLPKGLHDYFPFHFDWEAPCQDRKIPRIEWAYRMAPSTRDWYHGLASTVYMSQQQQSSMVEFSLNGPGALPWYRRTEQPLAPSDDIEVRTRTVSLEDEGVERPKLVKGSNKGVAKSCPMVLRGASRVSWGDISVHCHPLKLGDNPSCISGPPVTIDWKATMTHQVSIDEYEKNVTERRHGQELILPKQLREEWLRDVGYSRSELKRAVEQAKAVRSNRASSSRDGVLREKLRFWRRGKRSIDSSKGGMVEDLKSLTEALRRQSI